MEGILEGMQTKEDHRIAENRGSMGVVLLRKKEGSEAIGSGSIVNMVRSEHFRKREKRWCLLTSDVFRDLPGELRMENYLFECDSNQTFQLSDVAQSTDCYQPTAGLVLIPVHPPVLSRVLSNVSLKSSVFDDRRKLTFPTEYYVEQSELRSDKICFIAGSFEAKNDSWTVERFTLKTSNNDQELLQYVLQADDGSIFQSYDEIVVRSHLRPRGAPILKGEGPQMTCIGVLNFSKDGLKKITPIFFTPESLKGELLLYYPTTGKKEMVAVALGHSDDRTEVDASPEDDSLQPSQAVESEVSSSLSAPVVRGYDNHHHQPFSSTFLQTFTHNRATETENSDVKSTDDDRTVYPDEQERQKMYKEKRDEFAQLKQQSEEKDKTIDLLKDRNAQLRIDMTRTEQQNEALHQELQRKKYELRVAHNKLQKMERDRDREWKDLRENNEGLRKKVDEMWEEWRAESKKLRQEIDEKTQLRTDMEKLRSDVKKVSDNLHVVLDLLTAVLGNNSSSSEDVKAENLSGSSDSAGSCKRKSCLDQYIGKVASKLD